MSHWRALVNVIANNTTTASVAWFTQAIWK